MVSWAGSMLSITSYAPERRSSRRPMMSCRQMLGGCKPRYIAMLRSSILTVRFHASIRAMMDPVHQ